MPSIDIEIETETPDGETETTTCEHGTKLRDALLREGISPHNIPTAVSCHGLGTCATCSVEVKEGKLGEPSVRERVRLRAPVLSPDVDVRLACQARVTEDVRISVTDGVWGKKDRSEM